MTDEITPPDYDDRQQPEQEPPRKIPLVEKECDDCGNERKIPKDKDICESCAEARAFSQIEAPEDGWPRGSDMDRI